MAVASVTRPICPPSASISLTICPLAMPPTAGLQLICAILFMSMVTRQVLAPMLAAAVAASHPAATANDDHVILEIHCVLFFFRKSKNLNRIFVFFPLIYHDKVVFLCSKSAS
jgi:hypothetical protein